MNELLRITERDGQQLVDARDLHAFLESKRQFGNWIQYRIKAYGFVAGVDFFSFNNFVKREKGATTRKEYALTISCAKELAMVEGNKKGKAARLYFIECERRLKESSLQQRVTVLEAKVATLERQLVKSGKPVRRVSKSLPAPSLERKLVQKHFQPSPDGGQLWSVQQVMDFLQKAEKAKELNRCRIGTALSQLCGPRQCKWIDNRTTWVYSATLTPLP